MHQCPTVYPLGTPSVNGLGEHQVFIFSSFARVSLLYRGLRFLQVSELEHRTEATSDLVAPQVIFFLPILVVFFDRALNNPPEIKNYLGIRCTLSLEGRSRSPPIVFLLSPRERVHGGEPSYPVRPPTLSTPRRSIPTSRTASA